MLRFPNVSAHHCQLQVDAGYWYVHDQKSRNGVKVNGTRSYRKAARSRRHPQHRHAPLYGAVFAHGSGGRGAAPSRGTPTAEIFSKSLLERAGSIESDRGPDQGTATTSSITKLARSRIRTSRLSSHFATPPESTTLAIALAAALRTRTSARTILGGCGRDLTRLTRLPPGTSLASSCGNPRAAWPRRKRFAPTFARTEGTRVRTTDWTQRFHDRQTPATTSRCAASASAVVAI